MIPGEIFWVEFAPGAGHEQSGRRPAVVLQDDVFAADLPLVILVPLTGATAAARFAGTLLIEPDDANHLRKTSVALVFQIRAVDRRVVRERIGALSPEKLAELYALLDRLTGNPRNNSDVPIPDTEEPD